MPRKLILGQVQKISQSNFWEDCWVPAFQPTYVCESSLEDPGHLLKQYKLP